MADDTDRSRAAGSWVDGVVTTEELAKILASLADIGAELRGCVERMSKDNEIGLTVPI